jgi:phosphoribosylformimino-5-aminoimidazole carboxamide ribotide isomerase
MAYRDHLNPQENMKILPVLDLLKSVVVRGVAGQRDTYLPVASCLTTSADASDVARAFRDTLALSELYVADLDAILHQRPNQSIYRSLVSDGFKIMVDAGLTNLRQAEEILSTGASSVIAGLETIPGPELLGSLCETFDHQQVTFSLDLQEGVPLGDTSQWETADPFEIGMRAVDAGVRKMIVLDLAQVGVGEGVPTQTLCRRLQEECPQLQLTTGGGVRDSTDLKNLQSSGIDAVLVASALHNGRIGRAEIDAIQAADGT